MIWIKQGNDNWWDFQWTYSIWKNNWICILPQKNLVKNIWFWKYATHSTNVNDFKWKVKLNTLKFPLIHTQQYKINNTIEQKIFENTFNLKWYSWIIVLIWNITRKLGIYKYAYRIYEKLI
jgi:hypothetical protein